MQENLKLQLVLDAKDEADIAEILAADQWVTADEFDKKFGFSESKT